MLARARTMVSCTRSSARSGLWASDLANARKLGSAASMTSRTSGLCRLERRSSPADRACRVSALRPSPDGARPEHTCGTASRVSNRPSCAGPDDCCSGGLLAPAPAGGGPRAVRCWGRSAACGAGPSLGPWQVQNTASRSWARPWDSSGQAPLRPIRLRRETALGQMPCQRAVGFPILEADQVIGRDRLPD